jgi:hypothetical protein
VHFFPSIFVLSVLFALSTPTFAFSIWGHPTDNSVCDLGPRTIERIDQRQYVPLSAPNVANIYGRLVSRRIIENCQNGQVLILNTVQGDQIDETVFAEVSKTFCTVSNITRTSIQTTSRISGQLQNGFEVRCKITKFESAKSYFDDAESKISTDTLLQEALRRDDQGQQGNSGSSTNANNKDCSKLTMASVLFGGGGCR